MDLNTRVIKEPRGFIRIIQFVFAILAFSTTAGFDTRTTLDLSCTGKERDGNPDLKPVETINKKVDYKVAYPFNFKDVPFEFPENCSDEKSKMITKKLDMQFSSSAQFFVTTGVLCLLYSLGSVLFYVFMARYYETNPLLPMIDLAATAILSVFWLAGAIAWAVNVSDIQHYTSPEYLKQFIPYCKPPREGYECSTGYNGNWASLNVSLIVGFGNVFVWSASCWFVFKETTLHRKPMQPGEGPQGFDSFGDQTRQMPQQNQFQQQQLSSGY